MLQIAKLLRFVLTNITYVGTKNKVEYTFQCEF